MSVDFIPNINSRAMTPFRFWCQKVLPLVYDDSLSYYELLCKVVDYINKLIDDDKQLVEAYTKLQDYVNNYFDNLDVQEEINQKIDKMAEDGSLSDLIARYIDPAIEEQTAYNTATRDYLKEQIDNQNLEIATNHEEQTAYNATTREYLRDQVTAQNTEIAAIRNAVGSPLIAQRVSDMVDRNKIYVYTGSETGYTNGHWYYYNGSVWVSGGVYNSVAVATDTTLSLAGVPADAAAVGDFRNLTIYNHGVNAELGSCDNIGNNSIYFVSVSAQGAPIIENWPLANVPGWLLTSVQGNFRMQIAFAYGRTKIMYRTKTANGWTSWKYITVTELQELRIKYDYLAGVVPIVFNNQNYNVSVNGITINDEDGVIHVVGKYTGSAAYLQRNVYINNFAFPDGIKAGKKYYMSLYDRGNATGHTDLRIAIYFNSNSSAPSWQWYKNVGANECAIIEIPPNAVGLLMRIEVPKNNATLDDYLYVALSEIPSNFYLWEKGFFEQPLLESCDLNTLYNINAFYTLGETKTYDNKPTTDGTGFLLVLTSAAWTLQIWYKWNGSAIYTRRSGNGTTWTQWAAVSGGNNVTNEYVTNHYTNTYNVTATPEITTDTNNYLQAPSDNRDMTSAIQTLLSTTGVCNLGPGTFNVTGIDVPNYATLRGCGAKTIIRLADSISSGYAVKLNTYSTVSNLRINGTATGALTPTETTGTRHGILFEGNYDGDRDQIPASCELSNLYIFGFTGGAITCNNTGYSPDSCIAVTNCYIFNCGVGLNIPYWSEFNKFINVAVHRCYYGCINNGGNNTFTNCDFSNNTVGVLMDNENNQAPNNTHGAMVNCVINHSANNTGVGIKILNCHNGFVFAGCQLFYSQIYIENSDGINVSDCNFGANNCNITITNGGLMIFSNNMHQERPAITIINNANVHFINCYVRTTGAAVTP